MQSWEVPKLKPGKNCSQKGKLKKGGCLGGNDWTEVELAIGDSAPNTVEEQAGE